MTAPKALTLASVATLGTLLLAVPALGSGGTHFGSELNKHLQPSNGAPGLKCSQNDPSKECTFILNEAYAPPHPDGKQLAHKDGTIGKISLIAATKGKFKLQVAKVKKSGKAKVIRQGPTIHYNGTPLNGNTFKIEKFKVNVPVKKGEQLAVSAKKISFVRCSGGGDNTLIYRPPLSPGRPYKQASSSDGCFMLLEASYK